MKYKTEKHTYFTCGQWKSTTSGLIKSSFSSFSPAELFLFIEVLGSFRGKSLAPKLGPAVFKDSLWFEPIG